MDGPRLARRSGAAVVRVFLVGLLLAATQQIAQAQLRPSHSSGQSVSPAFEGWTENSDGSIDMVFGYLNRNWGEELHVPVGPDNSISPGPADQGQPTRFLPRRNRFVFTVPVPADFGPDKELVWTLTAHGETEVAYGTLHPDYRIDNVVIMSETGALGPGTSDANVRQNAPPVIEVLGEATRNAKVGEPVRIAAEVIDDGLPPRRGINALDSDAPPEAQLERALSAPVRITVNKAVALHFAWFVYRGPGRVTFDPLQIKTWEDTRAFQNSPWSPFWRPPSLPEDGVWTVDATFEEPGTYVLRGRADDGGLYADVELTVYVTGNE